MLYLNIINTNDINGHVHSIFIENKNAYETGKLISLSEIDNLIIIYEIKIDKNQYNKRTTNIIYVFLNGKEDIEYSSKLKIDKKNT